MKAFAWTLDTLGLFAATVADVAYALAAVTGRDDLRVDGRAPAAPRIGVVTQDFAGAPEHDSATALDAAARMAERAGAVVRSPAAAASRWPTRSISISRFRTTRRARRSPGNTITIATDLAPLLRRALDEAADDLRRDL